MDFTKNSPRDLVQLALQVYRHGGDWYAALEASENKALPDRVRNIIKAAALAGDQSTWGSALDDLQTLTNAFVSSLRNSSVFARFYSEGVALTVPINRRSGSVVTGASGSAAGSGALKPVTQMSLQVNEPETALCAALVVVSQELLRHSASAESVLTRELRAGMTAALDTEFLDWLAVQNIENVPVQASPLQSLREALDSMKTLSAASRLYLIATPQTVARLAVYRESNSIESRAFPDLGVNGGTIGDITVLPADFLPGSDSPANQTALLVDASQLILSADTINLATAEHASVEMDTAPTGGADKVQVSLWQRNLVGLRSEQKIAFAVAREGAVVKLDTGLGDLW